jgi:hypothetical protein
MTDMQTQDLTTQTTADPATGARTQRSTTRAWSGRAPGVELVWLLGGIVIVLLAMDFILHASGANDVGFAAFVFSVGTALAAPFAGIFKTTYAAHGNLVIWADVLAMVVYALLAALVAKVVTMAMSHNATS